MKSINTKQVRIVKSSERSRREELLQEKAANQKKSTQETARDMMSTVTGWVNELHSRQQAETARAIRSLFPEPTAAK
ncbi:MAG: hypothetical protein MSG64_11735 [Pyrinomonadaceae bacterium MAG19_C2-C3]|nr:hypothetical protein [Pyrinomonadaceae bacterium MAG19_C2-C3]